MKKLNRSAAPVSRERILQEAETLIHLQGFHGTSLDAIAKRCRMTKANLLHHYKTKEALGLAVMDYKIDSYRRCCLDPIFSAAADPIRAVQKLFGFAAEFQRGNGCKAGCFVGNMALELSDHSELFRRRAGAFFKEWENRIAEALRRRQARGFFSKGMDPQATAEAVLSLYEGSIMLARAQRDPRVLDRSGRAAVKLLQAHAAAPPPLAKPKLKTREVITHGT